MWNSSIMNTEPKNLTRREAILSALKGTLAAAAAVPVIVQAKAAASTSSPEPEFVPENDYPFFGYEPEMLE